MRRALSEDFATAIAMLADEELSLERRVHRVRQILKRDRSLVRVFEHAAAAQSRQIRLLLRDAGRALAGLREGHALTVAARNLEPHLDEEAAAVLLAAMSPAEGARDETQPLADAAGLIAEAGRLAEHLPTSNGRRKYDRALKRVHRQVGAAFQRARATRATEDLHYWRKRLKDLAHLTEFGGDRLRHADRLRRWARKAEALLGDDHDLALLRSRVVQQGRTASARFVNNVEIGGRRAKLQNEAFAVGKKIRKANAPRLEG